MPHNDAQITRCRYDGGSQDHNGAEFLSPDDIAAILML